MKNERCKINKDSDHYQEMIGEIINTNMKYNYFNITKRYINTLILICLLFIYLIFKTITLTSEVNELSEQMEQMHIEITYRK